MRVRRLALACLLLTMWTGAARAGLFTDDDAQRKIAELQQQTAQLQQQMQSLEARLAKLENAQQGQGLVTLLSQVDALKGEMADLRGQLEVQSHDIQSNQKRQKDFYVDLDSRLRRLESAGTAATPSPVPPASGSPTPAPASGAAPAAGSPPQAAAQPAAPIDHAAETRDYAAALNTFKVGNYQAAIAAFDGFISKYPGSKLASSAQYWVGNSYFALRDYASAIAAQQKLINLYPTSQKVPDAMLNIASSQAEMGDTAAARKTLEDLVTKYPVSTSAELARHRLGSIK